MENKSQMVVYPNRFLLVLLFLVFSTTSQFDNGHAQTISDWSAPERITGYADDTEPPYLIADQNRTVHAFTSQWVGDDNQKKAIIYNQWTMDRGWTPPVDVLLSPLKSAARLLGAFLDSAGRMHVIFFGGDNTQANIYYAKAPAVGAGNASAWSSPVLVGKEALNPENGALLGDDEGNLVILFSGKQNGNGLYAVYSTDYGDTWSDPEPIFLTQDEQLFPFDTKMDLGQSGVLHVVWSNYDISGNGVAVYYADYDIGRKQWSNPLKLTSARSGLSTVIEYDERVIVIYNDYSTNAFWMRESSDNSRSWTNPVRVAPRHIGRNGFVSLTIDSSNVLHLFFGQRVPASTTIPDIHGMWHSTWQGLAWSEPEAVVSGPGVNDPIGEGSFDPYNARAVVSQGNVLLVAWQTDPGLNGNGIWYSFTNLAAPELPVAAFAPEPSISNSTPTQTILSPTYTPINSPEPSPAGSNIVLSTSQTNAPVQNTLMAQIAVGIIPVVFLVSAAFIYKMYHRYRP